MTSTDQPQREFARVVALTELCGDGLRAFGWADDNGEIGRNGFRDPLVGNAMMGIAILIETRQGSRILAADTPREAALKAESVIATVARTELPVPVWVAGASFDMADRLMNYLADVQMERVLADVA